MHAGRKFTIKEIIVWTRRDILAFIIIAAIPTILYELFHIESIGIPWLPVAVIGTAVAFIVGFKNNATYDRLWEARKIYGAIVNTSRTWGIMSRDFVTAKHSNASVTENDLNKHRQKLIYRHIAWLTALRYQLRVPKEWEHMERKHNKEYKEFFRVPEHDVPIQDELEKVLESEEINYLSTKSNKATQLLAMQSKHLKELLDSGMIEDFRHMEMENILKDLFTQQGKCERIKNFPYPRQFATLNLYFVWLFIILLPFGMLKEFSELGNGLEWLTIPFTVLVAWVFHTMDKIGESSENPFEGSANDVPISALSRTIEIDLREMIEETDLPEAIQPVNKILM